MPDVVTPQATAHLVIGDPTLWYPLVKSTPSEHHLAIWTRHDPSNQLPGFDLTQRLLLQHPHLVPQDRRG
ncbi:MAG: hypothetical protein GY720_03245 [bacterium]|nr:hypothetical protein [bacterium]